MKKSTKGALAAGTAAVLLLGGAGSLAYWSDSETITGGTITAGHLDLTTDATNTGCGEWTFDSDEDASGKVYATGDLLVPGDVLTRTCSYTLDVEGEHMRGTVAATTPTNTLPAGMTLTSPFTLNGETATSFTEANDGQTVKLALTLTFDSAATGSMDADAVLGDITISATQEHGAPAPVV